MGNPIVETCPVRTAAAPGLASPGRASRNLGELRRAKGARAPQAAG